jgi:hypothetical protein
VPQYDGRRQERRAGGDPELQEYVRKVTVKLAVTDYLPHVQVAEKEVVAFVLQAGHRHSQRFDEPEQPEPLVGSGHDEDAAGLENAQKLSDCKTRVEQVLNHLGTPHQVELAVRKRKP